MHGGHVRAFGDPLFLKQTYGKGYQVNLTVPPAHSAETQDLVATVLPDATCVMDETASALSVTVPRNNLRGLPRLFTWLESSSRAALIIKEWGVSNTTLEQVFLMLCDMNTEINNVSSLQTESNHRVLCPMCRQNMKSTVFMRNLDGRLLIVPDSLCWECVNKNDSFVVSEEEVSLALQDGTSAEERMASLLIVAQSKAETVTTQKMLALENSELTDVLDSFRDENVLQAHPQVSAPPSVLNDEQVSPEQLLPSVNHMASEPQHDDENRDKKQVENLEIATTVCDDSFSAQRGGSEMFTDGSTSRADGAPLDQVKAIFIKNIVLQSKQKCSNCCSVFFVGLMFLMLYLMSLIFQAADNITVCDEGYQSDLDCSQNTLVDHIFSGS